MLHPLVTRHRSLVTALMFSILQTCVPAYRLPVFDAVAADMGEEFRVVAGDRFFDPSIRTVAQGRPWFQACDNRFLAGNRLLWQSGKALRSMMAGPFIVEANPRCLRTWLLLVQARRRGVRTAVWGHALGRGVGVQRMAAGRRTMFGLADDIICYCYAERKPLQAIFPYKRILVAGNATVRQEEFVPLGTPAVDRNSVLFLGRLVKAKKPMLLLEALRVLQRQGLHVGAVFVGDGPQRLECERFAREAGLSGVAFAGEEFSRAKIRDLASSSFVLASPGYVGLSVLDGLSMGLPVAFCHDEPNAPEVEVLEETTSAAAFRADDAQSLAATLQKMHAQRLEWLVRGEQGCAVVKERYSIERMVSKFIEFFRWPNARGMPVC